MSQSSNTDDLTALRCSICSGFLSCSPVRLLPDGTFICGQCSPPSNDSSIYRAQALEALLEKSSFPCRFAHRGCTERFLFAQSVKHELKCEYRSFACPFLHTACAWEGSTSEMFNHFAEEHQEQILENSTLKLEVDQNTEEIATVLKENIVFVVKYHYDAKSTHLTYDIRFCKRDSALTASYRLQLINNSDPEYTISLKTVDCSVYDNSFCNSEIVQKLTLDKFLHCLDNPTSVLISIYFTIHSNKNNRKRKLDYEVPDSLTCKKCKNYLIPPLFQLNKNVFCSNCAGTDKNYLLLNDEELLGILNKTMFPCRWRNCEFITKNKNLKKHQLECQFRQYNCFWTSTCNNTFMLDSAANHYKAEHRCQYAEKQISFEVSFAECRSERDKPSDIFTIKKHTIIDLEYLVCKKITVNDCYKVIRLCLYSSDESIIKGNIHFEHQHCKVKSDSFEIICEKESEITLDQLPTCFKENDVLTGILTEPARSGHMKAVQISET